MDNNTEKTLLLRAMAKFHEATGMTFNVEKEKYTDKAGRRIDAVVNLVGVKVRLLAEVKPRLTRANLLLALMGRKPEEKLLLVTDYVNPVMAEELRNKGIEFIDAAGNAYINEPPVYVYVKGNKQVEELPKRAKSRAFQATGLKVLFAFLRRAELLNAPYREIARAADVALGTVGWVLTDLKDGGYLVDMGKRGRRLRQKKQLVDRWVTAYPEVLRPKLIRGRYMADNDYWWKNTDIREFHACWGGEVAAAKLTRYLKPEFITVYVTDRPEKLLIKNKLKKDPDGNVEILDAFWETGDKELAPPLLIYADLVATGDARNIETARMIYEKELAGLIGED